jgi:hypothetical protein
VWEGAIVERDSGVGDYAAFSDAALLARLIGTRESKRLYKGTLRPFFSSEDSGHVPEKCKVAKELVRRSLHEELRTGVSLTRRMPFETTSSSCSRAVHTRSSCAFGWTPSIGCCGRMKRFEAR